MLPNISAKCFLTMYFMCFPSNIHNTIYSHNNTRMRWWIFGALSTWFDESLWSWFWYRRKSTLNLFSWWRFNGNHHLSLALTKMLLLQKEQSITFTGKHVEHNPGSKTNQLHINVIWRRQGHRLTSVWQMNLNQMHCCNSLKRLKLYLCSVAFS